MLSSVRLSSFAFENKSSRNQHESTSDMMKGIFSTCCSSTLRSTSRRLKVNLLRRRSQGSISTENPLEVIQSASKALQQTSSRLDAIHRAIQTPFALPATGQKVQLKDIVLHARDSDPDDFHHANAKEARRLAQSLAETVEADLQSLAAFFAEHVQPQLRQASTLCQELPCGGASFELDLKHNQLPPNVDTTKNVHIAGKDTPCGKLASATLAFWQQTYDTKEPIILGSRAGLILRLAKEYTAPLKSVRKEKQKEIAQAFQKQVVNTPWIRSEEEYQQFFQVKGDLSEKTDEK